MVRPSWPERTSASRRGGCSPPGHRGAERRARSDLISTAVFPALFRRGDRVPGPGEADDVARRPRGGRCGDRPMTECVPVARPMPTGRCPCLISATLLSHRSPQSLDPVDLHRTDTWTARRGASISETHGGSWMRSRTDRALMDRPGMCPASVYGPLGRRTVRAALVETKGFDVTATPMDDGGADIRGWRSGIWNATDEAEMAGHTPRRTTSCRPSTAHFGRP